jgi:hypothetical protein
VADIHELPRRRSGRWSQWPIAVVLIGIATSLVAFALGEFRVASILLAASVVLALFLRLLLPTGDAGLLVVRSRAVDVSVLAVLGLGIALLATWVPLPS